MEIGSLKKCQLALAANKLDDNERLILAALIAAGYDEEERPRGHGGRLSANTLARVIYPTIYDSPTENLREEMHRTENCKRRVRATVNSLIMVHGIPIMCMAGTGGGYYLPANAADVEGNHQAFYKRAMTGLVKAARGRRSAYADAMVQLTLGFESEAAALGAGLRTEDGGPRGEDGPPAWVSVVSGLLQQVKGDPAKYASEIKRIQDEFGDIFVRRDQVARIKQLSTELNKALEGLQA